MVLEYEYQNAGWNGAQWDSFFEQLSRLRRLSASAGLPGPLQSRIAPVAADFARRTAEFVRERPAFWGRHYGFLRVSRTAFLIDGLEVAMYGIPALQDGSFVAGANLAYEPQGGFQLRLDMRYLGGPGRSEFGRLPTRTLMQVEVGYGF